MNHSYRIGEGARVAVLADSAVAHLLIASGSVKLVLALAEPAARAIATELREAMPPGASITRRPAVPRVRHEGPTNWPALVSRLRAGKPLATDAEKVAALLSYLGVNTT